LPWVSQRSIFVTESWSKRAAQGAQLFANGFRSIWG
jgi:hypothetical protein